MTNGNRTITTEDGKVVHEGDRVFNYYDGFWGTLGPIDDGGWADVHGENGKRAYLNGQRISTYDPKGTTDPAALTSNRSVDLALLRQMKQAQMQFEGAYREQTTEELMAAEEFFELFDRLVMQLGWAETWKAL